MKKNWEVKRLEDVCEVIAGQSPEGKYYNDKGDGLPFYQGKKDFTEKFIGKPTAWTTKVTKEAQPDDILISVRAPVGPINFATDRICIGRGLAAIRAGKNIIPDYLFYCLSSMQDVISGREGAVFASINKSEIENLEIPLPPLPEQQRLVAILDEVFAALATAKENAAKNLQNARELFESVLQGVFVNRGVGWEERRFEECFKLKSGDGLTSKMMSEDGVYPVFGGNGIAGLHNNYNLSGSNIIIGRVGALCGNVRHIKEKIWLTDNAFKVVEFKYEFDHSFLTYLLHFKNLRSFARQSAQPVISNSSLKDVLLQFPKETSKQRAIVAKLDALSAETKKLEAIYQQKLANLEELKQSVLRKAFRGEI